MIEVIQDQSGDRAEADDIESAIVAARTLCEDVTINGGDGAALTVTFVLAAVPEAVLQDEAILLEVMA